MSVSPDPIRLMQTAARAIARHVSPGTHVERVLVLDAAGSPIVDIRVPPADESPTQDLAAAAAAGPRPGWDFSTSPPRFDGSPIPIYGRKADVLRVFAESEGPVSVRDLAAAWGGIDPEEVTIRWYVGDLKSKLKELFPDLGDDLGDPIVKHPAGGYLLVIR